MNIPNHNVLRYGCVILLSLTGSCAWSSEKLIRADFDARVEYNDNIFLSNATPQGVSSLVAFPSVMAIVRESNWNATLDVYSRFFKYSDNRLDGEDNHLGINWNFEYQRDIFSVSADYTETSNLTPDSTDFGLVGKRIERQLKTLSASYTRLMTERLNLSLSYSYSNTDYFVSVNTGFTDYETETKTLSSAYDISERSRLTSSMQVTDYRAKTGLTTYRLLTPRIGFEYSATENLRVNFSVGSSRRNTVNLVSQTFSFLENNVSIVQENRFQNRGLVVDSSFGLKTETGQWQAGVSRDNSANSFGGLNQIDAVRLNYDGGLSEILTYKLSFRYENVKAVSAANSTTDRDVVSFEAKSRYFLSKQWQLRGSYRYTQRQFKTSSGGKAPHSNRIYIGLTYNFSPLSTF